MLIPIQTKEHLNYAVLGIKGDFRYSGGVHDPGVVQEMGNSSAKNTTNVSESHLRILRILMGSGRP